MSKDVELSPIEYSVLKSALLVGIRQLRGKCPHGLPSYYDLAKWMDDPNRHNYDGIVAALHKMEAEGLIIGVGGYYLKGTHSGAGAKKWDLVEGA